MFNTIGIRWADYKIMSFSRAGQTFTRHLAMELLWEPVECATGMRCRCAVFRRPLTRVLVFLVVILSPIPLKRCVPSCLKSNILCTYSFPGDHGESGEPVK